MELWIYVMEIPSEMSKVNRVNADSAELNAKTVKIDEVQQVFFENWCPLA